MSSKERHALEKAALDDPFLADALEGYSAVPVNVNEDISELKRRLSSRTEESKSIRLPAPFSWWKIAAMVILVAGAALLVYQLGFNNKNTEIAQANRKIPANAETAEQNKPIADSLTTSTFDSASKDVASERAEKDQGNKKIEPSSTLVSPNSTTANVSVESNAVKEESVKGLIQPAAPPITFPPANADDKSDQVKRSLRNDNAVDKSVAAKSTAV